MRLPVLASFCSYSYNQHRELDWVCFVSEQSNSTTFLPFSVSGSDKMISSAWLLSLGGRLFSVLISLALSNPRPRKLFILDISLRNCLPFNVLLSNNSEIMKKNYRKFRVGLIHFDNYVFLWNGHLRRTIEHCRPVPCNWRLFVPDLGSNTF